MPIGTITMILANVGLQIFNNWRGSKQNQKLQQKREEFERAARERNRKRMLQFMREGQELTLQLEEEKHQQRLDELKNDVDNLLQRMAYTAAISNWPLNVLPIVMKNQALGNLLANQEENIAMHCIFTPSNCREFNKHVFPLVEKELEAYCNQHWSIMSNHPILFYSGAWQGNDAPSGVQIDSMRTALSNLPTLLITPFFRPSDGKLVFHARTWGVGTSSSDEFVIPEIEPTDFQRPYTNQCDYIGTIGLLEEIVEDLVPYLECMIGYMADTYFWASAGLSPNLPHLLMDRIINTDGMKYLVSDCREYYSNLLTTSKLEARENPFSENNLVSLFEGLSSFIKDEEKERGIRSIFSEYCSINKNVVNSDISSLIKDSCWDLTDLRFITEILHFADSHNISEFQELRSVKDMLTTIDYDYSILDIKDLSKLNKLVDAGNSVAMYRLGEIHEYGMRVPIDDSKAYDYYRQSAQKGFIFAKLKTGVMQYNDIAPKAEAILRSMNILQLDVLYSDEVLSSSKSDSIINEAMERLSQTIMSNIMTGRAYSHAGLLYNLASLKIKTKDYKTAQSMADLAVKLGYTKASNLI